MRKGHLIGAAAALAVTFVAFFGIALMTTILVIGLTLALMWQSLRGSGGVMSLLDLGHKISVN